MSSVRGEALCIIPARGGSRRFPQKNVALFAGQPLLGHAIRVAQSSGVFRSVCVSSEDDAILAMAKACGADLALRRDAQLARYENQVKDVCAGVIRHLTRDGSRFPFFAVLLPTSPLRRAEDIQGAYDRLIESGADCCMSVVAWEHPPQRALSIAGGRIAPFFDDAFLKPAQSLETLYRHDGAVLFVRTDSFMRSESFYAGLVVPYLIPRERAVDIDDPLDLVWAEFLARRGDADAAGDQAPATDAHHRNGSPSEA